MKIFMIIITILFALFRTEGSALLALTLYYGNVGPPGPNEIHIGKTGLVMPMGKILLVRKGSIHCAVKFTECWSNNISDTASVFVASGADEYAIYESYYVLAKDGDLLKGKAQNKKGKLWCTKPRGIGRMAFSFGNVNMKCGSIKLFWLGHGAVEFFGEGQEQGDYGIEFAPTPWTDISQSNLQDPRIKWYRYDENRKEVNIPIDNLWKESGK